MKNKTVLTTSYCSFDALLSWIANYIASNRWQLILINQGLLRCEVQFQVAP